MDIKSSRCPPPTIIEDRSLRNVHIKKYRVCGHLGKGGFANVYRVQSMDSSKIYACKIITKSKLVSSEHKRKLVTEIKLHQSLQHKNIVKFERHFEDKKNVYILLECCSNGSLMELSMKRKRLSEDEVRYFMNEILIGMKYLHSRCVIHRDLKLGNILLDKNLRIKICDFGLAAKLQFDSERKTTICGTPNYTAPEILNQRRTNEGHSYEVDIWSIGVIMFTLLTGKPPFETRNIKETYRRIRKIKYQFPINSDEYISIYAKNLIAQIFTKDPTKRPNLYQIRNDSFFTKLPTPNKLPMSILKRTPTKQELFGDSNTFQPPQKQTKRSVLVSNGFKNNNYNVINNHYHHQNIHRNHNNSNNNKNEINDEKHGLDLQNKEELISIIKYCDYTKKYGIGYILSNGCTGIYFNDSTKILLHENKQNVVYIDEHDMKQFCSMLNYPSVLKKKVTLLRHFTDYLWKRNEKENNDINQILNALKLNENHDNDHNDDQAQDQENKIYLKTTVSDQYCMLFKLSNNTVQVNFTDSSQIIIRDKNVMYKDKTGNKQNYPLNTLFNSNRKDLKKRCKYTQQLLQKIASNKLKNE